MNVQEYRAAMLKNANRCAENAGWYGRFYNRMAYVCIVYSIFISGATWFVRTEMLPCFMFEVISALMVWRGLVSIRESKCVQQTFLTLREETMDAMNDAIRRHEQG